MHADFHDDEKDDVAALACQLQQLGVRIDSRAYAG